MRLLKPKLNLALEIPTHPRAKGPARNEKAQWIEVSPGCARSAPKGAVCHNGFGGRNRKAKPNEDTSTVGGEIEEPGLPEV